MIGTKLDQAQAVRENSLKRSSSIAEECGADEINLVSSSVVVHEESRHQLFPFRSFSKICQICEACSNEPGSQLMLLLFV